MLGKLLRTLRGGRDTANLDFGPTRPAYVARPRVSSREMIALSRSIDRYRRAKPQSNQISS